MGTFQFETYFDLIPNIMDNSLPINQKFFVFQLKQGSNEKAIFILKKTKLTQNNNRAYISPF